MNFNKVEFLISAASTKDFPKNRFPEIAFAGKSNVGKSSVINRILNRKNFARVGDKPGKTIHVNYFTLDSKCYLVDLPGYGYSKTSKEERDRYSRLIEDYFAADQENITRIYMIVDARHKPTADDVTMVQWVRHYGCPLTVVANKLDKLKNREIEPNMQRIRETLELDESVALVPFSAEKGIGKTEVLSLLQQLCDED